MAEGKEAAYASWDEWLQSVNKPGYAIRFNEKDGAKGLYFLLRSGKGGVGLKGGIYIVDEETLQKLDRIGLGYEKRLLKTNDVDKIIASFKKKSTEAR